MSLSLADAIRRRFPPERIVDIVEELVMHSTDDRVRLAALSLIKDRGYGKVLTEIEIADRTPQARVDWSSVAPERRRVLFAATAEIEAVAGASNDDGPAEH